MYAGVTCNQKVICYECNVWLMLLLCAGSNKRPVFLF